MGIEIVKLGDNTPLDSMYWEIRCYISKNTYVCNYITGKNPYVLIEAVRFSTEIPGDKPIPTLYDKHLLMVSKMNQQILEL